MVLGELSRLRSPISSVSIFLEINITQIEASMTLFAFVISISQFLVFHVSGYIFWIAMQIQISIQLIFAPYKWSISLGIDERHRV